MTPETSTGLSEIASETSLHHAWRRVALKHGAAGIDHVTVEEFERRLPDELCRIGSEILSRTYQPQPLIVFPKAKHDSGYREITVGTVRDRVAARSTADYLNRLLDARLQPQSYAYRAGKGALHAVAATQQACRQAGHVARVDIGDFFDSVDHERLTAELRRAGVPPDVLDLVLAFVRNPRFDGVAVRRPERGIPQGSPVAPVLANLFLDPLDRALNAAGIGFVRYADDLVAFAADADAAAGTLSRISHELENLGLRPAIEKSRVYAIDEGFPFLGFLFSRTGHTAGPEARERLHRRLAEEPYDDDTPDALRRRREAVVRGWNNYFHAAQTPEPFDETCSPPPQADGTAAGPQDVSPDTAPAAPETGPLSGFADPPADDPADGPIPNRDQEPQQDSSDDPCDTPARLQKLREWLGAGRTGAAINGLRRLLNDEDRPLAEGLRVETLRLLAQAYSAQGLHGAAAACLRQLGEEPAPIAEHAEYPFGTRDVETWMSLFGGSEESLCVQYVDGTGRCGFRPLAGTLTPEALRDHWEGVHTLAVPIFRDKDKVPFAVLDLDINRVELDQASPERVAELLGCLLDDARHLLDLAVRAGVQGIIEFSGCKGYHVWFLFHQPISAALAASFLQQLVRVAGPAVPGTHRECFPASPSPSADGAGTRIKLPCGIHRLTGRRTVFLGPDGTPCRMQIQTIGFLSLRNTAAAIRNAVETWTRFAAPAAGPDAAGLPATAADPDVALVMERCSVLAALARKARQTRNLSHYERLVVRGVLEPLGQPGRDAIHEILGQCDNYNRRVTEGFLGRPGVKPMGCVRIREILGEFCAQAGCACRFAPRSTDYAHPLRHLGRPAARAASRAPAPPAAPQTPDTQSRTDPGRTPRAGPRTSPQPDSPPESSGKAPPGDCADLASLLREHARLRQALLAVQNRIDAALDCGQNLTSELGAVTREPSDPAIHGYVIRL